MEPKRPSERHGFFCFLVYNSCMVRKIAPVVRIVKLQDQGTDFAYWQTQPFEARIAALEEIRREYIAWENSLRKDDSDVQPGFQRVYRIVKR
jgi:hypothetical protein